MDDSVRRRIGLRTRRTKEEKEVSFFICIQYVLLKWVGRWWWCGFVILCGLLWGLWWLWLFFVLSEEGGGKDWKLSAAIPTSTTTTIAWMITQLGRRELPTKLLHRARGDGGAMPRGGLGGGVGEELWREGGVWGGEEGCCGCPIIWPLWCPSIWHSW